MAFLVTACIIFVELTSSNSDIYGQNPSFANTIKTLTIEAFIILGFGFSAVALFRWTRLGWWLSGVLDGLLGVASISMVIRDFKHRDMATSYGHYAFWGDITIHGAVLCLCVGAMGFLVLARKHLSTGIARG